VPAFSVNDKHICLNVQLRTECDDNCSQSRTGKNSSDFERTGHVIREYQDAVQVSLPDFQV
jgi:hypothetical protein